MRKKMLVFLSFPKTGYSSKATIYFTTALTYRAGNKNINIFGEKSSVDIPMKMITFAPDFKMTSEV